MPNLQRLIDIQGRSVLIRKTVNPELAIHNSNINRVLGHRHTEITDHRDGQFPEGQHSLQINEGNTAEVVSPDSGHTAAEHDGADGIGTELGGHVRRERLVAEELAVLVVDVGRRVRVGVERRGELRERSEALRVVLQGPGGGVAAAPVQGDEAVVDGVVDDTAVVVVGAEESGVVQGPGLDLDDCCGAVGPVLRQRGPDVFAVVVDAADVVLDVAGRGQRGVGDEAALAIVDQDVCVALAGGAVCPVDRLRVLHGWDSPLTGGDKVSLVADTGHALWLAGVTLEGCLGDEVPLGRAAQVAKGLHDCCSIGGGVRCRELLSRDERLAGVDHGDIGSETGAEDGSQRQDGRELHLVV